MGSGVSKPQTTASASKDVKQQSMTEMGSDEYPTNSTAMQGSEEDFDIVCVPCHRDGTRLEALGYCCQCQEHLCGQCCQTHKKATLSRHHKILVNDSMPTTQQIDDYTLDRHTDTITKPCPRHKNEMLKLYCQTHSLLLCSKCVALAHTKSCKVAYIPDISEQMIGSKEYEQTVERMETLLTECTRIKQTTDADTSASNKSLDKVLKDLKQYRREMNEKFDKMEKATEHEIHTLKQQNVQRKNEADAKCDDTMKTVQSAAKSLNELNASNQADMLFVELKQTQEQLKEHEKTIHYHTTNNQIDEFVFVRSTSIDDALLQNKIGDIKTKNPRQQDQVKIQTLRTKQQAKEDAVSQTPSHTQDPKSQAKAKSTSPQTQHEDNTETKHQAKGKAAGTSSQSQVSTADQHSSINITPTYQGKVCVRTIEDRYNCWITGLTMLSKDKLVLTDADNNSVKLVDVNNNIVTSHLPLTGEPCDITSTSSTQIAVTLPYKQQIQFINVSDKLSLSHTIQTDGECRGICYQQNKMVITYNYPRKIEIISMDGKVITCVEKDSTRANVFSYPEFVQANSNNIYVSDRDMDQVIMLNWQGDVTGKIGGLVEPRGLALLHDGSLLVCDWLEDRVYHVSGDCTKKRAVLQDVRRPYTICVDEGGHTLYISRSGIRGDKINNNIIIVYNI